MGRSKKTFSKDFFSKIKINFDKVFTGTNDDVVPTSFSRKILKICKKSKKKFILIKNGDHSLSRKKDVKKNVLFCESKFKWGYLSEFLSPRKLRSV